MEILSQATGTGWKPLSTTRPTGQTDNPTLDRTIEALSQLLLSENLVVLSGLGSSMDLVDAEGKPIAPGMSDLWDAAKAKAGAKFGKVLAQVHYGISNGQRGNIEDLLSHCQMVLQLEADDNDNTVKGFVEATESIIAEKCRFPGAGVRPATHETFLRRVARRSPRLPRTRIFTTNYDLCFEVAANSTRFVVVDGFSHTFPQEFDGGYFSYDLVKRERDREAPDYVTNVFHLYKVHGSVDWERQEDRIIKTPNTSNPCLIYPRQGKYQSSYDQPFLEMMSRFQIALRQPNTGLLIVGFGFNDAHLVQPIMSAVRSNVSLRVMIVDPAFKKPDDGEDNRKSEIMEIEKLIEGGDSRLSLLAARFGEFVPIIPDLVAKTEDEVHGERARTARGRNS